jgi:hypothetical protein
MSNRRHSTPFFCRELGVEVTNEAVRFGSAAARL